MIWSYGLIEAAVVPASTSILSSPLIQIICSIDILTLAPQHLPLFNQLSQVLLTSSSTTSTTRHQQHKCLMRNLPFKMWTLSLSYSKTECLNHCGFLMASKNKMKNEVQILSSQKNSKFLKLYHLTICRTKHLS